MRCQVSIPLRKFPRVLFEGRDAEVWQCFHSTKEVSKAYLNAGTTPQGQSFHSTKEVSKVWPRFSIARCARVSIPLRKFPRGDLGLVRYRGRYSFHSTKEVSKAGNPGPVHVALHCFHSTKEVSKELRCSRALQRHRSFHSTKEVSKDDYKANVARLEVRFHSTKEVSKVGHLLTRRLPCRPVSIPLRKFPRQLPGYLIVRGSCVSIPLRKFPRPTLGGTGRSRSSGFHSTKEVSKGGHEVSCEGV